MATSKKLDHSAVAVQDIKSGMQVKVHQLIKETNDKGEEKTRTQVFEGLVIARKHGNEIGATFTVRKVADGIGVEKTYPIHSPLIEKIELVDTKAVRRSKIYFVRDTKKKLKSVKK